MSDNLDTLRKIAEAATPGPWTTRLLMATQKTAVHSVDDLGNYAHPVVTRGISANNAEHVATFDPPTVLALITRLEQAEQAAQRVREVIHQYDPDCLTCMCNSDGDCCKCTVADFQEALDGDTRG